ncbi:DUF6907 domain-containing protein [Streptomyces syringium]|uniref:DUF6907 domain-containing protein n=1 Tax=Streptomyces syringium TaxID=76729 RepID=UPI0037D3CF3F
MSTVVPEAASTPPSVADATIPSQPVVPAPAAAPPVSSPGSGPRTWVRKIHGGGQVTESCPSWCTAPHQNDQGGLLDDLAHQSPEVSARLVMPDWSAGVDGQQTVAMPILAVRIQVDPYSEDPRRSVPFASVWPWEGEDMGALTSEELGGVIGQMEAHLDCMRRVRVELEAAIAQYGRG